ncbi:DUF5685 family protein [Ruminococcus sp. JL13D9]|uniref:DUF5685 family protein n=1 Tax=Ruminococcus sp. JL13D9 TaxID=3233381 RepID=UPI0038999DCB
MFGYLQIHKDELKVKEYEAYKSAYCGLCKQLGRDYGFLTRLILSYDCTFYAILLMSLKRSCTGFSDGRCKFNPLKKCKFADCKDNAYSKASALSVISAYYKVVDDIDDSGFFKRIALKIVKPFFGRRQKKAARRFPEIEIIVSEMMKNQKAAENDELVTIDKAANPTAKMISDLAALEGGNDLQKRVLSEFGYQIGRWVYLIDAADDYEKDKKSGNFNPFIKADINDKDYINSVLSQSLARAYDAYNLLDIIDFKPIIDNMMLYGFPNKQNAVLNNRQEVKNEQSV